MAKKNQVPDFMKATKVIRNETARMAAKEAVDFFKSSFVKGGFTDSSFSPWQKSKSPMAGKRTLYKLGTLMHSIRRENESQNRIVIGSHLDYADIHNNGGHITVTKGMKAHFWKLYAHIGKAKKKPDGRTDWKSVRKNKKTEFLKRMALMPVGSKIKIPKRQFIGHSAELMKILAKKNNELTQKEMAKAFKQIRFK